MKIAELKTFVVGNPPPAFGGRYFLFLKLKTACGIEGVGEVYAASFAPKRACLNSTPFGSVPSTIGGPSDRWRALCHGVVFRHAAQQND